MPPKRAPHAPAAQMTSQTRERDRNGLTHIETQPGVTSSSSSSLAIGSPSVNVLHDVGGESTTPRLD